MAEDDPLDSLFRFAASWFSEGNFSTAESLCHAVLLSRPRHAGALDMIGRIAAKLGNHRHAVDYFQRATAADPAFAPAQTHLEKAQARAARATKPAPGPRYLVIKAWGYGFWSEINHVCGSLLLAEITGRIPLTLWGGNSLFTDGSAPDAFALYFEAVSDMAAGDLPLATPRNVFPPKWAAVGLERGEHMKMAGPGSHLSGLHFLERPETIAVTDYFVSVPALIPYLPDSHSMKGAHAEEVYRYLAAKYLKPKPYILGGAEALHRKLVGGEPAVAVHMRGSDKIAEGKTAALLPLYFEQLDRQDPALRILLLTDDARFVAPFTERYGFRVVFSDVLRTESDLGIHHMPGSDRARLGREVAVDTYAALLCRRFIGNGMSNLSAFVSVLKPWEANACVLLGGSILHVSLS